MKVKEIAELAGVSIGTVDRVLHGRGRVSPETKARIEDIVQQRGFTPNPIARRLKRNRAYTFYGVLPKGEEDSGYWGQAREGIFGAADEIQGYGVETKILDFDNNMLIVPNNELIKTKIINYAYPANEIRVFIDVGVAYGNDIAQVKNILNSTAKKHPLVLKEPVPESFLMSFGESALQFRLSCRVSSFQDQFGVAENLRVQIYEKFKELKIEIPLPQRVVHHTVENTNALQTSSKRKKIQR